MKSSRILWVTGAGSGIGRASALRAARDGWRVVLSGRRTAELAAVAHTITDEGGEALVVPLDVSTTRGVREAYTAITETWDAPTDLVLSAGMNTREREWGNQSLEVFENIVQTNLLGVARVIDVALPGLRAASGRVVVIASYAGWRPSPGAGVAYGASKLALSTLCESLNREEAKNGVRACNLCPGDINTDFLDQRPTVPGEDARGRMLQPEDVARAVAFVLDSPEGVIVNELVISPTSQFS